MSWSAWSCPRSSRPSRGRRSRWLGCGARRCEPQEETALDRAQRLAPRLPLKAWPRRAEPPARLWPFSDGTAPLLDPPAALPGRRAGTRAGVAPAGLCGALGSLLVLFGASQGSSPYDLKVPGAWFFGLPHEHAVRYPGPAPAGLLGYLGVVGVLGGMALLVLAWIWLVRVQARTGRVSGRRAALVIVAWTLPLLLVAPLFSRDVYTYAAQGEMMTLHLNPYLRGPAALGRHSPFERLADPLWRRSVSPYGPLFLLLDEATVLLTGHSVLATVEVLRLVFLAGLWLGAVGAASLARRSGRDPVLAVLLVAANPLFLVHLVAGAHDDALMLGVLLLGLAAAVAGRPWVGIGCCALAAAVKVPALLGCAYIGWSCLAPRTARLVQRAAAGGAAVLAGTAVLAAFAWGSGLGWGWVKGLGNAGIVRLWLSPTTGTGMAIGRLLQATGLIHGRLPWLRTITVTRDLGAVLAAAALLALLGLAGREGPVRATAYALLAVALLGAALWPWYLTWGIGVLAAVATRRERGMILVISAAACYLGVPAGSILIGLVESASAGQLAAEAAVAAGAVLVVALVSWLAIGTGQRHEPRSVLRPRAVKP